MKKYLIQGPVDSHDNTQLYWSNQLGWVSIEDATIFTEREVKLYNYLPSQAKGWVPYAK
jgi:hypothetical protein